LRYIVIDELHAFIGSERGKQLQSLMHRVDISLNRTTPRIALSATLGDMGKAAEFLRPKSEVLAEIIESKSDPVELRIFVKAYVEPHLLSVLILLLKLILRKKGYPVFINLIHNALPNQHEINEHIFKKFRRSSNLIFPNSRKNVEFYADVLREKSKQLGCENTFLVHHGNLSKTIRTETEAALKSKKNVTAICTSTLELGINIGDIEMVGQIGSAPSVSSLRQRLGRSGRKEGKCPTLWGYVIENEISINSTFSDLLREDLVQFIAQINLLMCRWYEPPEITNLHLSTFIQQLLSLIAQYEGISVIDAWKILCTETFNSIPKKDFIALLRELGTLKIIIQDSNGVLLHGAKGEKIVNDYKFYAAFKEEQTYRMIHEDKILGTLPYAPYFDNTKEHHIVFAGKRWKICNIDIDQCIIYVIPAKKKLVPDFFGESISVNDRVRQEMYSVLSTLKNFTFLDKTASLLLEEARHNFHDLALHTHRSTILDLGDAIYIFPWAGTKITHTIALILNNYGISVDNNLNKTEFCFYILVHDTKKNVFTAMENYVNNYNSDLFSELILVSSNPNLIKQQEKWDYLLPEPLLSKNYASSMLDIEGAIVVIKKLLTCF
jgi:ATP-dependent Lhr-like helicase